MSGDIHALSGAYAVDALDDQERDAFERHLAVCSACQAEVDSLREAAISLADAVSLTPPPHLRAVVLDNIARVRPLPPVVVIGQRRAGLRVWLSGSLVAAAAIALLLVWIQPRPSTSAGNISAADQVVRAQDTVSVRQQLTDGATVVWYRSADLNRAAVRISDLPNAATGKTYELWLQGRDGVMHPAGLVRGGTQLIALKGSARSAVGAGLTLEPAGGSTKPTLPAVTLAGFPTA